MTYFCPDIYSNELPGGIDTSFAKVIFAFVPPPAFEVDESINNVTFALVASLFAAKIPRITVASTPVCTVYTEVEDELSLLTSDLVITLKVLAII